MSSHPVSSFLPHIILISTFFLLAHVLFCESYSVFVIKIPYYCRVPHELSSEVNHHFPDYSRSFLCLHNTQEQKKTIDFLQQTQRGERKFKVKIRY